MLYYPVKIYAVKNNDFTIERFFDPCNRYVEM